MHWLVINFTKIWILSSLTINGLPEDTSSTHFSNPLNDNQYIASYDEKSFFESNLAEQVIDVENIDQELLNATFFFELNKIRTKARRTPLNSNEELLNTCKNIVKKYSGSTFRKYNNRYKHGKRFQKILKKRAKEADFKGAFIEGKTNYLPLVKSKKKKRYIYNENIDEGEHLFFYKKKEKRKGKKEYRPIKSHTYQSFIDSIFKYQSKSKIKEKYISEVGCYIQVFQKSKKKIPYAKVIWIVGGYRLNLINE